MISLYCATFESAGRYYWEPFRVGTILIYGMDRQLYISLHDTKQLNPWPRSIDIRLHLAS